MNAELRQYAELHYKRGIITAASDFRQDFRNLMDLVSSLADPTNHAPVILADVVVVLNLFGRVAGNRLLFELTPEHHHTLKAALLSVHGLEPVLYDSIPVNEAFQREIVALGRHSRYQPDLRY